MTMTETYEAGAPPTPWSWLQLEPRFELSFEGRMLSRNAPADALLRRGAVSAPGGRLKLGCLASNRALDRALERLFEGGRAKEARRARIVVRLMDSDWRAAELFSAPGVDRALLVLQGDPAPASEHMRAVLEAFDLTQCEGDVLALIADGLCPKEIARELNISEHTVRSHLRALYGKLGVRGVSNLLRLALRLLA